ncbi:tryptophanase leader peptide [Atlantibacter sp.]|nr:tryptophanase leader peptide [Atlantibacter sp.]
MILFNQTEDDVMKHTACYRLIAKGGLNAWYNLDPRISNDFPR